MIDPFRPQMPIPKRAYGHSYCLGNGNTYTHADLYSKAYAYSKV